MCGRYRLTSKERCLAEQFDLAEEVEWSPCYNIAPSDSVATIRQDANQQKRTFSKMRWGLIPSWAKGISVGYSLINVRSETVLEKVTFRDAFKRRRCLIPADGFCEWKKQGKRKHPIHFAMADDSMFALAGKWSRESTAESESIGSLLNKLLGACWWRSGERRFSHKALKTLSQIGWKCLAEVYWRVGA